MSGGSYDYLFIKDWWEIHGAEADLEAMRDRLAGLGYADDAARETAELLLLIRQYRVRVNVMMERLSGVFRAVEWWDSCDSSEDQVKIRLKEYRGDE